MIDDQEIDDLDLEIPDAEETETPPAQTTGFTAEQVAQIAKDAVAEYAKSIEKPKAKEPIDAKDMPAFLQADKMNEFRQDMLDEVEDEFPDLTKSDLRELKAELRNLKGLDELQQAQAINYHTKWAALKERDNRKANPPAITSGEPSRTAKPARQKAETPISGRALDNAMGMIGSGKFTVKELVDMSVITKEQGAYITAQQGA